MSRLDQTIDPTEVGCQLLLIGPVRFDPAAFAGQLDVALAEGGIAGFVLTLIASESTPEGPAVLARRLRAICAGRGVAFLLRDQVALGIEVGADGVHLGRGVPDIGGSRTALGSERILGVSCGHSRDAAMVAGQAGADYVAFGDLDQPPQQAVYDLIEWWSELFVLPCLAEVAATAEDCARLARAGADFVAAGETVWTHPDGVAVALRRLKEALRTI